MINDTSSLTNTSILNSSEFQKTINKKRKIIVLGGPGVGNKQNITLN